MKWKREGGVVPGGDVGGDYQATESWSVRYRAEEDPTRVVTVYFFGEYLTPAASEVPDTTGVYKITRLTEATICREDGPTPLPDTSDEVWSDSRYDEVETEIRGSLKYIDEAARGWAVLHTPSLIVWNGVQGSQI